MIENSNKIIRYRYLEKISGFIDDVELIKVLVGQRRCGKSVLMTQIIRLLTNRGIDPNQIIYYDFELLDYDHLHNAKELYSDILTKISNDNRYYIFFDEVQKVEDYEKVLNSLRGKRNASLFITGSNSSLFSSELSTSLSGRYISFEVFPFTFSEAVKGFNVPLDKVDSYFEEYLRYGGLPHRFSFNTKSDILAYLNDIYDSIVKRDIILRSGITDIALFQNIFSYIIENNARLLSPNNVYNYLISNGRSVAKNTVYKYIEAVKSALLTHEAKRYDVNGKEILITNSKYYSTDLGIGAINSSSYSIDPASRIENAVYNELLVRGYDVYVGHLKSSEIDFVAIKDGKTEYYQVSYLLSDQRIVDREFGAFRSVADSYPKYVLSLDKFDMSQNGIIHINVIDWLLHTK